MAKSTHREEFYFKKTRWVNTVCTFKGIFLGFLQNASLRFLTENLFTLVYYADIGLVCADLSLN